MINRDDMLELTRRMTPSRNCFFRIAGAYMDEEGYADGTFNLHFGKLGAPETRKNLELAKAIPFSRTNEQLTEYRFAKGAAKQKSMWPLLMALKEKGLKEDGLLELLYELMGESLRMSSPYSIFLFYGAYDVPVKGTDGQWLEGSEEQYAFLVCAVSPLAAEYEPGRPEFGFLFPAFSERSSDPAAIYVFHENPENRQEEFLKKLVG